MTSAREEILGRVRHALRDVPPGEGPQDVPVERGYRGASDASEEAILDRFAERVRDYRAELRRIGPDAVADEVAQLCGRLGLRRIVVPGALPQAWRPPDAELIEDRGLSARELDAVDGALTGCAVAIAETGTIALDGRGRCGRRAITLVPDHHICVVQADQVVASVPEAIAALTDAATREHAPVTLISGPSASSDIELSRVEGVHGPRTLVVLLVAGAAPAP